MMPISNLRKLKANSFSGTKSSTNSAFSESAIAGLAAKEDYTSVKLKQTDSVSHIGLYPPYNDIMLIQIKGRRHCQARLVEPCVESLNKNDCFILVSPGHMFLWIGESANIIEKSKANELYECIRVKKDLGIKCSTLTKIIDDKTLTNDENNQDIREFYQILNSNESIPVIRNLDDDETYETLINDSNMVFKVSCLEDKSDEDGDEERELSKYYLEPVEKHWGSVLSHKILNENDVIVFDFGTEVYVWNGRNSLYMNKKSGLLLARKLYEEGYDYSECRLNPINPRIDLTTKEDGQSRFLFKSSSRPEWTLFGRQSQNVETNLFKAKFNDWPNLSTSKKNFIENHNPISKNRPKSLYTHSASSPQSSFSSPHKDLFNYEALDELFFRSLDSISDENIVNLVLENTNLGRGRNWYDETERRRYQILTENVTIWKINNNELVEIERYTHGEFNSEFTYVIKWQYKVNAVGFKTLKGEESNHQGVTGRDRFALFFWQGDNSSQTEKGTSALLSLQISNLASDDSNDSKRLIPHVQIYQNREPPVFCQIFDGNMIILEKKFEEDTWKMFQLRGELEEEAHLVEIKGVMSHRLRSRMSFLFVNLSSHQMLVWHGCLSSKLHRQLIVSTTEKLKKRNSAFGNKVIEELEEGLDSSLLNEILREKISYSSYNSLVNDKLSGLTQVYRKSPRLFLMSSLLGQFEMKEIFYPLRSDNICPYPFHQFNLHEEKQPALFLLDNDSELYIWQGWFDSMYDAHLNNVIANEMDATNGSSKIRYTENRKCAMQTAINYWNYKHSNNEEKFKGFVVYAGLEPVEFTTLFPHWEVNIRARNCNLNDGKILNQKDNIETILAQLNQNRYPASVLRQRPLPDGVNPLKLECYLNDQEFEELLHTSRVNFSNLPAWKQSNLKKNAHLF